MPIKKGSSQNTISKNIGELMKKRSKTRAKAVSTLAKKLGITPKEARRRQAVAIALSTAGKPLSKTNK